MITAPIYTKDIQDTLGESSGKLSVLCQSPNINPYSAVKPIVYPTMGESCPDFKGAAEDNAKGIFYGLKIANQGYSTDIHTIDFAYIRPTGVLGIAPFRKNDFNGYDENAKITLTGYSAECKSGKVVYNWQKPLTATLEWNRQGNTTGVDVLSCTQYGNAENWYLCVVVDNYMRAMINEDAENRTFPIYYNNIECKNFACPELLPTLQSAGNHTISFVLVDADGEKELDVKNSWVDISATIKANSSPIGVPNMIGYKVQFVDTLVDYGILAVPVVSYSDVKGAFIVECDFIERPQEDRTYLVQFRVTNEMGERSGLIEATWVGGADKGLLEAIFTDGALGLRIDSGKYTYEVAIYGYENNIQVPNALITASGELII